MRISGNRSNCSSVTSFEITIILTTIMQAALFTSLPYSLLESERDGKEQATLDHGISQTMEYQCFEQGPD